VDFLLPLLVLCKFLWPYGLYLLELFCREVTSPRIVELGFPFGLIALVGPIDLADVLSSLLLDLLKLQTGRILQIIVNCEDSRYQIGIAGLTMASSWSVVMSVM
jgi:hypothetical protein